MKKNLLCGLLLLALFCVAEALAGGDRVLPRNTRRYLVMCYTNLRYDSPALERKMSSQNELYGSNLAPDGQTPSLRMHAAGFMGPMLLTQSVDEMRREVNTAFQLGEKYAIPVFFQLDDMTNYTKIFGAGDSSEWYRDPEMCEWIAFPDPGEKWGGQKYGRLPRWYFNWGGPMCSPAVPNFRSPKFRLFVADKLRRGFLEPLQENLTRLQRSGREWLFVGCNIGWETHIPVYNQDDLRAYSKVTDNFTGEQNLKMEPWECAQYGYAALHAAGYNAAKLQREAQSRHCSAEEVMQGILYEVIRDYSAFLARILNEGGIGKDRIFTHVISLSSATGRSSTFAPPVWVAVNRWSTPGFTANSLTCPYNADVIRRELLRHGGNGEWIVAESYAGKAYGRYEDAARYLAERFGGESRIVTVFGCDSDSESEGYETSYGFWWNPSFGYVRAVREWRQAEKVRP